MNEEEKKAVKYFYNLRATIDESNMLFDEEINVKHGKETIKQITIILNLIVKLQKENEELNKENEHLHREINRRIKLKIENEKIVDTQFIYKQKIKDKIKELSEIKGDFATCIATSERIKALSELLESEV